jgi:hypothetical protein
MQVKQIAEFSNNIVKEATGEIPLLKEDLSNFAEHGKAIQDVMGVENYTKTAVDRVGKVVVSDRLYEPPLKESVMRDDWEYGSVVEKFSFEPNQASVNESWQLEDGAVYETNNFVQPKVNVKFYNGLDTFKTQISLPQDQANSGFTRSEDFVRFIGGIQNQLSNDMSERIEELSKRIINNMIGETMYNLDAGGVYSGKTAENAVNLLYIYNQASGESLNLDQFIRKPEAIREAVYVWLNKLSDIRSMDVDFNIGKKRRFTPSSMTRIVMLNRFKNAADIFLQSDTFNDEYTKLPSAELVGKWQGKGDGSLTDRSTVKVTTSWGHDVEATGILGVMYDRDALGIHMENQQTTSKFIESARFYNYWHFYNARYWCDDWENFIVFYAA